MMMLVWIAAAWLVAALAVGVVFGRIASAPSAASGRDDLDRELEELLAAGGRRTAA